MAQAESQIRARRYREASSLLSRATASAPNDDAAWSTLGYALLRQRRLGEAQDALHASLRLHPDSSAAWTHLADVLAGQNRQKAAVAALKLGIYFSPRRTDVLTYLRGPALTSLSPALRAIVRTQGRSLDELPEREK
jgi:Flp pilus assembly protein TadD